MRLARGCRETMSAFRGLRSSGNVCLVANDPQRTSAPFRTIQIFPKDLPVVPWQPGLR